MHFKNVAFIKKEHPKWAPSCLPLNALYWSFTHCLSTFPGVYVFVMLGSIIWQQTCFNVSQLDFLSSSYFHFHKDVSDFNFSISFARDERILQHWKNSHKTGLNKIIVAVALFCSTCVFFHFKKVIRSKLPCCHAPLLELLPWTVMKL